MLWLKAFHIVFVVTWFAGLFYLPRLFVYHAMADEDPVRETLCVMERRLLVMMHIGGTLSWLFGLGVLATVPAWLGEPWMQVKLGLVVILTAYHVLCARIVKELAAGTVRHEHTWYRWFNEVPTLILIAVVLLVELKPF
ncbi:CopD family protein [Elongatibacter sediminis]|uniref:Protoporphyrinogen IX oxidase n=1 Tax=Elongatibacter sediminis TaxID=3119006 RepID=A0AAW9RAT2_9GAMM